MYPYYKAKNNAEKSAKKKPNAIVTKKKKNEFKKSQSKWFLKII